MKKVYTTPFAPTAHIASELLEDNGIEADIQGESLPILAGSVPWQDTWPSVWVKDADEAAARELLKDFGKETNGEEESEGQTCPVCGEKIDAQFGGCWKCAVASQPAAPAQDVSAVNRARQGLVGALILILCVSYSLIIFAGSSRRAFRLIGHFTPYQIVGALVLVIGTVLSIYYLSQIFAADKSAVTSTVISPSRWQTDAAIRNRRGLLIALLVGSFGSIFSEIIFFIETLFSITLPQRLISFLQRSISTLVTIAILCCWYFVIKIIIAAKSAPPEMESVPSIESAELRSAWQTYRDGWYFILLGHVFLIAGAVIHLIVGISESIVSVKTADAFWWMSLVSWTVMVGFGLWKMVQARQQGLHPRITRTAPYRNFFFIILVVIYLLLAAIL